jgi:hypothetical protein
MTVPRIREGKEWALNAHSFTYPKDRLLVLNGTIPDK